MLTKKKNKESLCKTPTPDADADLKSIFVHWVHLLNKDARKKMEAVTRHKHKTAEMQRNVWNPFLCTGSGPNVWWHRMYSHYFRRNRYFLSQDFIQETSTGSESADPFFCTGSI